MGNDSAQTRSRKVKLSGFHVEIRRHSACPEGMATASKRPVYLCTPSHSHTGTDNIRHLKMNNPLCC